MGRVVNSAGEGNLAVAIQDLNILLDGIASEGHEIQTEFFKWITTDSYDTFSNFFDSLLEQVGPDTAIPHITSIRVWNNDEFCKKYWWEEREGRIMAERILTHIFTAEQELQNPEEWGKIFTYDKLICIISGCAPEVPDAAEAVAKQHVSQVLEGWSRDGIDPTKYAEVLGSIVSHTHLIKIFKPLLCQMEKWLKTSATTPATTGMDVNGGGGKIRTKRKNRRTRRKTRNRRKNRTRRKTRNRRRNVIKTRRKFR